jgi:hypothetical protein
MFDVSQITEHMAVVGSDGQHVGTVDRVHGRMIRLTKADPAAAGEYRFVPLDAVDGIRGNRLVLRVAAAQALASGADAIPEARG